MIREYKREDCDKVMQLWLNTNISAHHYIDRSYWENNYESVKEMLPSATMKMMKKMECFRVLSG